jgi:polar amino acid transport system substrate-binding protein
LHQFERGQDAAVIFVNTALQESDFYQLFLQGRDLLARVVSICNVFVVSAVSCQKLIAAACLWLSPVLYANQLPVQVVTEHLPPYQMMEGGKLTGYATEIVDLIFADARIAHTIEMQSWSRAYQRTLRFPNTCIYSMSASAERLNKFHWIGEIGRNHTAIYSLADRQDIQLTSIADAKQFTLAVVKDDVTHHYLLSEGFSEGKQLYVLENVDSMLNLLHLRRRIDLVIVSDLILHYRAAESGLHATMFEKKLDLPQLPLNFHLACSLKTPADVVQRLRQSLNRIKQDGRFDAIVQRWSSALSIDSSSVVTPHSQK